MDRRTDAASMLASLNADDLLARLDDLEAERRALVALLRSVRARDRYRYSAPSAVASPSAVNPSESTSRDCQSADHKPPSTEGREVRGA